MVAREQGLDQPAQWPLDTVYLGGGTPSQLGPSLPRVLDLVREEAKSKKLRVNLTLVKRLYETDERYERLLDYAMRRSVMARTGDGAVPDLRDAQRVRRGAALYRALGLQPIPPELREDEGELEAAAAATPPGATVNVAGVPGTAAGPRTPMN